MTRQLSNSLILLLLATTLGGCATYYQPRYGQDGVYYEQPRRSAPALAVRIDPAFYPYWSLDYFYFSRHYYPYSVVVHRYDPWYYPYPGWYYGYRSHVGIGALFGSGYYPWYDFGIHYRQYRPWKPDYIDYPRYAQRHVRYVERPASYQRVREIDERMRAMEQRQRNVVVAPTGRADGTRIPSSLSARNRAARSSTTVARPDRQSRTNVPTGRSRTEQSRGSIERRSSDRTMPRSRLESPRIITPRQRSRSDSEPPRSVRQRSVPVPQAQLQSEPAPPVRSSVPARERARTPPTRSENEPPSSPVPQRRSTPSRSRQAGPSNRTERSRKRR